MSSHEFVSGLNQKASERSINIPETAVKQLAGYFDLLGKWNQKINLTALPLTPPTPETFERLFVEPLEAAAWIGNTPITWFDLGSGSGSPAIPIKVVNPALRLTMVESRSRKAAFLREVVRLLNLTDVSVESLRFQQLAKDSRFSRIAELVTARAVRVDHEFIAIAGFLLKSGGKLVVLGSGARDLTPLFRTTERPDVFERCST